MPTPTQDASPGPDLFEGFARRRITPRATGVEVNVRFAGSGPPALLDVLPTRFLYSNVDRQVATVYFHWFFLIQPEPLPERLLAADAGFALRRFLSFTGGLEAFSPAAIAEYERCFSDPAAIHAMCEDYRAAESIDLEHDEADAKRKIECPVLILWGARGAVGRLHRPLEVWSSYAANPTGRPIDAGHYLAEERPDETVAALEEFLDRPG